MLLFLLIRLYTFFLTLGNSHKRFFAIIFFYDFLFLRFRVHLHFSYSYKEKQSSTFFFFFSLSCFFFFAFILSPFPLVFNILSGHHPITRSIRFRNCFGVVSFLFLQFHSPSFLFFSLPSCLLISSWCPSKFSHSSME